MQLIILKMFKKMLYDMMCVLELLNKLKEVL